jgi:DNA-binding transcriptional MerR regulator
MGKYTIKELERLSGIKAHTIRVWEKRHKLIDPARSEKSNIRSYTDDDLKKIINVSLLNNYGVKISKIAHLSYEDICKKVAELTRSRSELDIFIDQLVIAMIDMHEEHFESLVLKLTSQFGFEKTITKIIYPFLEKIGVLWQTGNVNPAQEHFISNLIRQKMFVAIDGLQVAPKTAPRVVLYLPEGELHEIGLLFFHYITKKEGFRTYYLGQTVPHNDLKAVCAIHRPKVLITSMTSVPGPQAMQDYIKSLSVDFPDCKVLASGAAIRKIAVKIPPNFHIFDNALKLKDMLRNLKQTFV